MLPKLDTPFGEAGLRMLLAVKDHTEDGDTSLG
jgi:hypothetical protein